MFTIYARRVTAAGLTSGLLAGLLSAVVMIGLSPTVHGAGAPIPLVNPAIVALPLAVAAVILVSRLTRPTGRAAELADEAFEAMRYQAVTGSAPRHQSDIRPDPEQRRDVEGAAK